MSGTKKYQVFISSTYEDLIEERKEAAEVLLNLDCFPAGMELFPGVHDEKWEVIKRVIDECDYFLLILAGRYGSGYTEKEYDYATSKRIPVMAFVHGAPGDIASKNCETDGEKKQQLEAFRLKVNSKMARGWRTVQSLGREVSTTFQSIVKEHPRAGWVRASETADIVELEGEITRLKKELEEQKLLRSNDYLLKVKKTENRPLLEITGTSNTVVGWIFDFKNVKGNITSLSVSTKLKYAERYANGFEIRVELDKSYLDHNNTVRATSNLTHQISAEAKQEIEFDLIFSLTDSGGVLYSQMIHCRGQNVLSSDLPLEITSPLFIPTDGPEGKAQLRKLIADIETEKLLEQRRKLSGTL